MAASLTGNKTFVLRESQLIRAPIDRCFLLSTSVEIVHQELAMQAVAGRTAGLAVEGDVIRWQGWQLGWRHHHVSQINHYQRPSFFQDRMIEGRFACFEHDHHLRETAAGTMLEDELRFSLPFGLFGALLARFIVMPHIRNLMRTRFAKLQGIAETQEWHRYLPGA